MFNQGHIGSWIQNQGSGGIQNVGQITHKGMEIFAYLYLKASMSARTKGMKGE